MTNISQSHSAAQRNKGPIFEAAQPFLQWADSVFEVGTGVGTHADYFCSQLPQLRWQPSDTSENLDRINTFLSSCPTHAQMAPAIEFTLPIKHIPQDLRNRFDAVYTSNTLHIMPLDAVQSLFQHIPDMLCESGFFLSYGPFAIDGEMSDSNRQFDTVLKDMAPHHGIRELRQLERLNSKLTLLQANAMPANNYLLIWET